MSFIFPNLYAIELFFYKFVFFIYHLHCILSILRMLIQWFISKSSFVIANAILLFCFV